jgi:hypothetical protein
VIKWLWWECVVSCCNHKNYRGTRWAAEIVVEFHISSLPASLPIHLLIRSASTLSPMSGPSSYHSAIPLPNVNERSGVKNKSHPHPSFQRPPLVDQAKKKKKIKKKKKTYNSGYSLVVTHPTTNPPISSLCMAERTGCPILLSLWSYVTTASVNISKSFV